MEASSNPTSRSRIPAFTWLALAVAVAGLTTVIAAGVAAATSDQRELLARGKYVIEISGCNDCHTAGYAEKAGKVPEQQWLTGDAVGWRGPWGTTYAPNLRTLISSMTAEQWLRYARNFEARPPMPWFNIRQMSDADLIALHAYVKNLGPAGSAAPAYLPPDKTPTGPVIQFPG